MKKTLKNREAVVNELGQMMLDIDAKRKPCYVHVYMYVDEDGNGTLETFEDADGCSYLDDDHHVMYTYSPDEADSVVYEFEPEDMVGILDIPMETLMARTAKFLGREDVEEHEILEYIKADVEMMEKVEEAYRNRLRGYYRQEALKAVKLYER